MGVAIASPLVWVIALVLLASEAACNAQARNYPEDIAVEMRVEDGQLVEGGRRLGVSLDESDLVVTNATVLVVDSAIVLSGTRAATGREAIGGVLGTWIAAIPAGLLLLVVQALLLPAYVRRQVKVLGGASAAAVARKDAFRTVFFVRLVAAIASGAGGFLGALPGLVLLVIAGVSDLSPIAIAGLVLGAVGGALGYLWIRLGLMFADRHAILSTDSARAVLAKTWRAAKGTRLRYFAWLMIASALELAGALGWLVFYIGIVTHSYARATADAWLTDLYTSEVAPRIG